MAKQYKVGDLVRVLRDSPQLSYWKKEDLFIITSINQSGFIYGIKQGYDTINYVLASDIEPVKKEINSHMPSWF